ARPGIVIINTSAVATIIHAVSAALMSDVPANAGVANEIVARLIVAADLAARHDSAPMVFPQPVILWIAFLAPLPNAIEVQEFRARRCRSRRCGSATRDRSASRISCRHRSGGCARWR